MQPSKKSKPKKKSSSSGSRSSYRCTTCSYVTFVKARFTKHVKYHNMPFIKCKHCDFKTPYKWNLDRHYKNHNAAPNAKLKCPLCNFGCEIKQSLTVHVQNHHTSVPENIGELLRQTLGYSAETPITEKEEEKSTSPKRRSSASPTRNNLAQTQTPKRFKSEPSSTAKSSTSASTPASSSSSTKTKSLFTKKFYKCRSCNFNALSDTALERHVKQAHPQSQTRRKSLPCSNSSTTATATSTSTSTSTSLPLAKPMPSLIPIPSKSNSSNKSQSHDGPPTLKPEPPLVKRERELPLSHQDPEFQENFTEKSKFLEYFSLKPKIPLMEMDEDCKEEEESQSQSLLIGKNGNISSSAPRRRTSFFEKLTQKLVANSKSDSESAAAGVGGCSASSITITSNSTRCQYCRHRCKSSVDLISHLGQCSSAKRFLEEENMNEEAMNLSGSANASANQSATNKVFVWNLSTKDNPSLKSYAGSATSEEDFTGYETAPGIGSVHFQQGEQCDQDPEKSGSVNLTTTKSRKVYKCPQANCGFWATTASRFHVHIVGHYNLKPFECSQCSYRSNWRWDITKHIKLKTMRDPSHAKAKVLLTHESGQRNYRKYDRYLMPMDVKYSADSKLPDCSTVASKRQDVELSPIIQDSVSPTPAASATSSKGKSASSSPGLKMPKLTKAPTTSASAVRQAPSPAPTARKLKKSESPLLAMAMAPPMLKPSISISPLNNFSKGSRTFVETRMLAGGEILQNMNMDTLGKEITVTPIRTQLPQHKLENQGGAKTYLWKCKKCSFKNANKNAVINHINQNHKPRQGEAVSILNQNNLMPYVDDGESDSEHDVDNLQSRNIIKRFPCVYCAHVLPTRRDLRLHMKVHGSEVNGDDNSNLSFEGGVISPEEVHSKPRGQSSTADGLPYKKYHCRECPYVTDSKGQFVYHKRFHIPSADAPFKCNKCNYHVSHKHLLHQHIRVHYPLAQFDDPQDEEGLEDQEQDIMDIECEENHPTVLVWKGSKPYKMFRCRFCPQVFGKLKDLMDHESEHDTGIDDGNFVIYDDFNFNQAPPEDEAMNLSLNSRRYSTEDRALSLLKTSMNTNFAKMPKLTVQPQPQSENQSQPNSKSVLYLCEFCPARFFYEKELRIHHTFHVKTSDFRCGLCSYSARQEIPHLMSHMKVHGEEYQSKTRALLAKYPKASPINYGAGTEIPTPFRVPISITPATTPASNHSSSFATSGHLAKILSSPTPSYRPDSSINCARCPAKFNTMASFIQHMNNHGRLTAFTCRHCDYGSDSANNITLHSILHAGSEITIEPEISPYQFQFSPPTVIPQAQSKSMPIGKAKTQTPPKKASQQGHSQTQPTFTVAQLPKAKEELYQGNPEFTYPTYIKNGRVKSKRYKCNKCPSAFEKRDQYKVHMGLHGSNQRYKCTVCDYSVTYYANFIQHLKKHENQPNVSPHQLIAKPLSKVSKVAKKPTLSSTSTAAKTPPPLPSSSSPPAATSAAPILLKIPIAATATTTTTTTKRLSTESNQSTESLDFSQKSQKCIFCDFEVEDKEALKDHIRLHFNSKKINENLPDVHMYMENPAVVVKSVKCETGGVGVMHDKDDEEDEEGQTCDIDMEVEPPSDETDEEDYEMFVKKKLNRSHANSHEGLRRNVRGFATPTPPVPDLVKSENENSE